MILSKILNTSINLSSNLFFFFKFVSNLFLFSSLFWNALWIYGKQRQYRLTYISIHHMNISTCFSVTTCIWTRLNWMNLGLLVARLINPLFFKITDWIMFCKMYFFFLITKPQGTLFPELCHGLVLTARWSSWYCLTRFFL